MRAIAIAAVLCLSATASARPADKKGIKALFGKMEQGLREKNEAQFKSQWHPEGYKQNLVGGSGIPGRAVFGQGSRKGWFLRPDLEKLQALPGRLGGPWIVRCDVWSWKKKRTVDEVHALLVHTRDKERRMVMLGGGERLEEVIALGQRWVRKKPLPPKKKK
jgi:hypothetical protein